MTYVFLAWKPGWTRARDLDGPGGAGMGWARAPAAWARGPGPGPARSSRNVDLESSPPIGGLPPNAVQPLGLGWWRNHLHIHTFTSRSLQLVTTYVRRCFLRFAGIARRGTCWSPVWQWDPRPPPASRSPTPSIGNAQDIIAHPPLRKRCAATVHRPPPPLRPSAHSRPTLPPPPRPSPLSPPP